MAEKPQNIGQALLGSLGEGVGYVGQNLVPFLQQQRQMQMAQTEILMKGELHRIQIEEAKNNLEIARAGKAESLRLAGLTPEEKAAEEAKAKEKADAAYLSALYTDLTGQPTYAPFQSALGGLQNTQLPEGLNLHLPSGSTLDFGQSSKSGGDTRLGLIEKLFGEAGLREELDPFKPKEGVEKTLSAKDQQVLQGFDTDYTPEFANQFKADYLRGVDREMDAFKKYRELINLNRPTGIGGMFAEKASPEAISGAAAESGYSPVYAMTKFGALAEIDKKEKSGVLTPQLATQQRELINKHFGQTPDEFRKNVLDWYQINQPYSSQTETNK